MVAYFMAGHACGVGCQERFAERSKSYKHCFLPPLFKIREILWHNLYSHTLNLGDLLEQAYQHLYQTPYLPPSPPSWCPSWTATFSAHQDTIFLTDSAMTFRAPPHLSFASLSPDPSLVPWGSSQGHWHSSTCVLCCSLSFTLVWSSM